MNKQEELYFAALSKDRDDSADTLDKPSMRGVKKGVVEKYSDQAHFIYELLQNADDAHATTARFVLERDRLIFAHNGSRRFSVSDPAKEDVDSASGTLGDINAITSIANSNKTEASIGKFGVGFKAVFQYTSTPHIYDPNFRFKIERFIVPKLLDEDYSERKSDETLFVFPFDHEERGAKQAYEEIATKLKDLSYPLLFLSDLKLIQFKIDQKNGLYGKEIRQKREFDSITAEQICLTQKNELERNETLWLFSRLDENQRRYSVGFFLDAKGKLRPVYEPTFCFFPTKEDTGLKFIVHAPFLLTDSREGVRAGVPHNERMVENLADLAAQAIILLKQIGDDCSTRLIDDSILEIVPYDPSLFSDPESKRRISFRPFYFSIREVFRKEPIIPTKNGYVSGRHAYWAATKTLAELFSDKQLAEICGDNEACWAFPSLGRESVLHHNSELLGYVDSIVKSNLNEEAIIRGRQDSYRIRDGKRLSESFKGIDADFIESQSISWLHEFYKWLSERKQRRDLIRRRPIFLNQDGNATAAFDDDDEPILFFPTENMTGFSFVHPALLENAETKSFIKDVGIKPPSLKDHVYNHILPLYDDDNAELDVKSHFKLFFDYYCQHCMNEEDQKFIDRIRRYDFVICYPNDGSKPERAVAKRLYLPSDELKRYFETKPGTLFVAFDEYKELVGASKERQLLSFLSALGVKTEIEIVFDKVLPHYRDNVPCPKSTGNIDWKEGVIVGSNEIIQHIEIHKDKEKSVFFWNCLLNLIRSLRQRNEELSRIVTGVCNYYYRTSKTEYFDSSNALLLRQSPWIVNNAGEFVSAENVSVDTLSEEYDVTSYEAWDLIDFLRVVSTRERLEAKKIENQSHLTDEQRKDIEFAKSLREKGISESDLEELERIKARREAKSSDLSLSRQQNNKNHKDDVTEKAAEIENPEVEELELEDEVGNTSSQATAKKRRLSSPIRKKVIQDIWKRMPDSTLDSTDDQPELDEEFDQDEYTPRTINYGKRIERAKQNSAIEIDRIAYLQELHEKLKAFEKYSFGWFKTLLEMEQLSGNEANSGSREVSISFAKVERQSGTERTLILGRPSRYIPQSMEELADIPLVLHIGEKTKTVKIEVACVQSYTLRAKLKDAAEIQGVDLTTVDYATVDVQSPAFLLEELRNQFETLGEARGFTDNFNLRENLCSNIKFVFGPPGTGKTTYLAEVELIKRMMEEKTCQILVLTPTNKAADVLTRRIMETAKDFFISSDEWLVRFGVTCDEEIEKSSVFKDKSFDIRSCKKAVVVTTIARFAYDCFTSLGECLYLRDFDWDYVVFDEASMIPIANVVYPLYKQTPKQFVIAGDPFQIEPVIRVAEWKNENIYTMTNLDVADSFLSPRTRPHAYEVKRLTTQYRSVPEIGSLFSNYAYGGVLKHSRSSLSQRPLNLPSKLNVKTLNIFKFPVSKYESVYRAKKLQNRSSYHIYSALFTYEYVRYLAETIESANPGQKFKIGVVAPYRAQADLIDKLLANEPFPSNITVQVGTIHGFQGDECDVVFAIFNTPPTISSSSEIFVNKRNIVNVAISRARDYLFIVMPDDETDGMGRATEINRIEELVKDTNVWSETSSSDIEKLIFDDPNYLENNAFSTGHQSVNVYGLPEKRYEVRTEDNAVDVQIHRGAKSASYEQSAVEKTRANLGTNENNGNHEAKQNRSTQDFAYVKFNVNKGGRKLSVQYRLVPFKGRLEDYTHNRIGVRYVGNIPVYLDEKETTVFISEDDYRTFDRSKPIALSFFKRR